MTNFTGPRPHYLRPMGATPQLSIHKGELQTPLVEDYEASGVTKSDCIAIKSMAWLLLASAVFAAAAWGWKHIELYFQ